ncbi:MAG: DUF3306 domain-containing protein [Yoonia sp.]|uniref:DUF3306 domain-containing protein n=1 Tax=Yoonia sp. TaxID=2212373 RepID=UPI00273DBF99|nr:DUF3306 domain-containing protein [Yoonia sp.]MDP5083985.1 DUF3306 domain-containing protein [Yoonia sp.]
MTDPERSRLNRWSQRKLDAKRQDEAAKEAPVVTARDEPEIIADDPALIAALPSLDEITADFDMTPFLAKGIPAHLKNAALRKLWQASPSVRDYLDPAVDYAWDWNAPGGVPGGGGVLSEQSIAKMVKGIIGKGSEDSEEVVAEDAAPEQPAPVEVAHQPDEDRVAVRRDTPPAPAQKDAAKTASATQKADLLPQRRHGGAVPE